MRFGTAARTVFAALMASFVLAAPLGAEAADKVIASGQFTGASNHDTSGGVTVVETDAGAVVVMEEDFSLDGTNIRFLFQSHIH